MPKRSWGVLIAAVNEEIREPLAKMLREKYDYQVETVLGQENVIGRMQGARYYDAVLLDDRLLSDSEDGAVCVDLIREMKGLRPTTEILISTGGDPSLAKLALREGAICCEQHPFDLENLAMHISQAIDFHQRAREKNVLEKLMEINSSLHSVKSEDELLHTILNGVHSFGFDRVRLYLLSEDRNYLEAVASLGMGVDFKKIRLPLKECYYMNELLKAGRSIVFNRDEASAVPFEDLLDKADVAEWASVPMIFKGEIIGKLSVDNKDSGLTILEEDLRPVEVCASHAATAIQNRRVADRADILETLQCAAVEVTEQSDRNSLLEVITRQAMILARANGCGIYALRPSRDNSPDKLTIIIDPTRPHLKGKELDVGQGAAGRLMESDESYWIVDNYEQWEGKSPVLAGANFGAVLEIKLTWKTRPIGVLYVDRPVGLKFTVEDASLLSLFAQHAASALVYIERSDNLERLLSSSPIGIIAVDARGNIDRINEAALNLLKYSSENVMGKYVGPLFENEKEPRIIGRHLHENQGKFANYQTKVLASDGIAIPILHSSTWRYDSTGNRAGSIGFFEDLRSIEILMEASDIVARAENPSFGLQELAQRMALLLPHTFYRILLMDCDSQRLTVAAAHFPSTDQSSAVQTASTLESPIVISEWPGLSEFLKGDKRCRLLRSDNDQARSFLRRYSEHLGFTEMVQSLLLVPLKVGNEPVGLLEFGELRSDRPFTKPQEQFAISIAANTAALIRRIRLYEDTQRRNQELERENQAFRMISGLDNVKDTLAMICSQAKEMFNCISATIWPYDTLGQKFIPKELVSDGISHEILARFRKTEPSKRGITNTVKKQDWLGVPDILDPSFKFLTLHMRKLLTSANIRSFQGVHLRVGDETVGVLYISYPNVRQFDGQDRHSLERFGAYAALSLKNARSTEQLGKEKAAAQAVARVIILGNLKGTLESVCREVVRLTGCDVAILYPYDEDRDRLGSPPTYHGRIFYPGRMLRLPEIPPDSLIQRFLDGKRTIPIEDTLSRRSALKNSRFTLDEKILSCIVVPLRVAKRKVGVMFVNYRSYRRFTGSDIANIELICRQAAIAVSNAQLYDRVNRQLNGQDNFLELSGSLLKPLSIEEIMQKAVMSAAETFGTNFSNIVLLDEKQNPVFRAGWGWPREMVGRILPNNSQTPYTVLERKAIHVLDYKQENRFQVSNIISGQKISSGLSVPMFDQDQVVGALLVHNLQRRRFSEREEKLLQLMANHTAIAIQNARRYQANERKSKHLQALNEAAKAITESFGSDRDELLNKILRQTVDRIWQQNEPDTVLATIQEYDEDKKEMVFVGEYPCDENSEFITDKIRKRRSIDRSVEARIGVIGRTVEEKTAQIVHNVKEDPDHVVFIWEEGSEITAPLKDGDKVLGVINVESKLVGAFDQEDLGTLKALADLAVIALRNSQQYEQLKQINDHLRQVNGLIGSRTVLQWMREIAQAWSHNIQTALSEANTGIDKLEKWVTPAGKTILEELRRSVSKFDPDILSQLVYELTEPIPVGDFITQFVKYLSYVYRDVVKFADPNSIDHRITIRASRSRLNFALRNVVDNAVQAMEKAKSPTREIIFRMEVLPELNKLKIYIRDSGPGMLKHIEDNIRDQKRIEKGPEESGMGIGLMLVRAMLASYDGDLLLVETGTKGTEFAITVPYQILESGRQL